MPRLPVHSTDSAPDASRDAPKALEARVGKVLNIYGGMAHSPAVLHAYVAVNEAVTQHSSLDAATREAIALAVGAVNDCGYCQAAHTMVGKGAGLGDDQMLQILAAIRKRADGEDRSVSRGGELAPPVA